MARTLAEHEARVLSHAQSYRVTTFLGRGRFHVEAAATLDEARSVAQTMLHEGVPMIYAIYGCHQVHVENVKASSSIQNRG